MKESEKGPEVAAALEGFFGRSSAIDTSRCVGPPFGCGRQIDHEEMVTWTEIEQREYSISGTCSRCQAQIFGTGEEEDEGRNGVCLSAADVGADVAGNPIACPHPDRPEHGHLYKGDQD